MPLIRPLRQYRTIQEFLSGSLSRLSLFSMIPPCWSHSPGSGIGQMLHHERPPRGMKPNLSVVHQAIHTMMMAKLWLPTRGPNRAVAMVKTKPINITTRTRNCGHRLFNIVRSHEMVYRLIRSGRMRPVRGCAAPTSRDFSSIQGNSCSRVMSVPSTHLPRAPSQPGQTPSISPCFGRLPACRS